MEVRKTNEETEASDGGKRGSDGGSRERKRAKMADEHDRDDLKTKLKKTDAD